MRVLHVSPGNLYGGIETLLVTLARHRSLCPDMEPHFALCFEGRLSEELAAASTVVHQLGGVRISRPWTVWRARRRLATLLARERLQVVICHGCWPHALFGPVARALGIPVVFWSHDAPQGRHWLERWARRTQPDLVLANSQWTRSAVPNLFPEARSEVLYCPVCVPETFDRSVIRSQVRRELETREGATVIIQVSRLERWKGQSLLLQALNRIKDVPDWECWIVGGAQRPKEAAYLRELQDTVASTGLASRVRFLGQCTKVMRLLVAADIHCQPNTGPEPFGIAFLEALYAGLPVVTVPLGGAAEIVEPSCGLLVPPDDAAALAAALQRLVEDSALRHALGAAGPARATELCDPARQMQRLCDVFLRALVREAA